jgi:fucose permease
VRYGAEEALGFRALLQDTQDAQVTEVFARERLTWASYWMLGYFAFLQTILGPLMPFIRGELHLNYVVASLHFSAFALGAVVTGVFGDRMARRWGRRTLFWGGALGMAVGAALVALSPSAAGTILGAFLMGLLGDLALITLQAALAERHGRWGPVALTEANVVASGFAILATLAVGAVTGAGWGWRLALLPAIALLALIALRYHALLFPRMAQQASPRRGSERDPERGSKRRAPLPLAFWALWLLIALETGVEWCLGYWGASFLATQPRFSRADAATAMSAFFVAMLVGRALGSRVTRVVNGLTTLGASLGVGLLGFALFWLAPSAPLHIIGLFVVGFALANVYPLGVALAAATAPEQVDTATARLAVAGGLAVLLAPLLLGALADHIGIGSAFGVAIPLLALALVALAGARRAPASTPARAS